VRLNEEATMEVTFSHGVSTYEPAFMRYRTAWDDGHISYNYDYSPVDICCIRHHTAAYSCPSCQSHVCKQCVAESDWRERCHCDKEHTISCFRCGSEVAQTLCPHG